MELLKTRNTEQQRRLQQLENSADVTQLSMERDRLAQEKDQLQAELHQKEEDIHERDLELAVERSKTQPLASSARHPPTSPLQFQGHLYGRPPELAERSAHFQRGLTPPFTFRSGDNISQTQGDGRQNVECLFTQLGKVLSGQSEVGTQRARITSCPYKKRCFSLQQAVISFDCY